MTARSSSSRRQLADEMRARVLANIEAWIAIRRPVHRDYDPSTWRIESDDPRRPLEERDPRAIELEYRAARLAFWNEHADAGHVRLAARRAVRLARHLAQRALAPAA